MNHQRSTTPWPGLLALALLVASGPSCSEEGAGGAADIGPDLPPSADAGPGCPLDLGPPQTISTPPIHTPRWAFSPWISKDISDGKDTYDFVAGFETRDIPVGVVVIDSPWETNYNTFIPNPARYPKFDQLVKDLHAKGIRVVLWATQMVNQASMDLEQGGDKYPAPSPNYAEGEQCGFFVDAAKKYLWWKGAGSGVDFFNDRALTWWHRQQDNALKLGIDGWKLDFGESYINVTQLKTAKGMVSHQAYSEAYYRDTWAYGVHKRGAEFVTMVRGYDKSYQFPGRFFARPEHAPVIWAGDNTRDWDGLADALDHIFRSAAAGYVVVGSDIGGYLDLHDQTQKAIPFDQDVFVRWVALGALCPFMQLHGRQNLTPWTVSPKTAESLAIYRYWSWLHEELVPMWYSLAQEAHAGGAGIVRPVGQLADWGGDYRYQIGEAFLVAPVLDGTGKRDVELPAGAQWYDWWRPQDPAHSGGTTLKDHDISDQTTTIPLFVRAGAIIPAEVSGDVTGLGTSHSKGHLTVLVYPAAAKSSFKLHETDDKLTTLTAVRAGAVATIELSRVVRPTLLRVRMEAAPSAVKLDGTSLTPRADTGEPVPVDVGRLPAAGREQARLGQGPGRQRQARGHPRVGAMDDDVTKQGPLHAGFIGAWILLPESCNYEQGDPPRAGTYRISEAEGGALDFEIGWIDSGGEEQVVRFSGVPDGGPAPIEGGELADAISVSAVSARELTTRAYWRGKERMVAQRQLDDSGAAMRVTQLVRFDDGTTLANTSVYRRQLPS